MEKQLNFSPKEHVDVLKSIDYSEVVKILNEHRGKSKSKEIHPKIEIVLTNNPIVDTPAYTIQNERKIYLNLEFDYSKVKLVAPLSHYVLLNIFHEYVHNFGWTPEDSFGLSDKYGIRSSKKGNPLNEAITHICALKLYKEYCKRKGLKVEITEDNGANRSYGTNIGMYRLFESLLAELSDLPADIIEGGFFQSMFSSTNILNSNSLKSLPNELQYPFTILLGEKKSEYSNMEFTKFIYHILKLKISISLKKSFIKLAKFVFKK